MQKVDPRKQKHETSFDTVQSDPFSSTSLLHWKSRWNSHCTSIVLFGINFKYPLPEKQNFVPSAKQSQWWVNQNSIYTGGLAPLRCLHTTHNEDREEQGKNMFGSVALFYQQKTWFAPSPGRAINPPFDNEVVNASRKRRTRLIKLFSLMSK